MRGADRQFKRSCNTDESCDQGERVVQQIFLGFAADIMPLPAVELTPAFAGAASPRPDGASLSTGREVLWHM